MSEKNLLLKTFESLRNALFSNDVETLSRLMAEDYVGYDPEGNPQDFQMSIDAYQPGCVKLDRYDVQGVEVRVIGEVGVITGKGYIHGTFAECEFEHHVRFLDLYVKRNGRWQLYLSQVTPMKVA